MSGGVKGAGPIQRDEKGEAMVCTGCGTTRTVAAIVAGSATAFTCCPERKMIPARTMWHAWCDANDARPSLTAPPARTYAEGVAMACAHFEQAIGDGYPLPADKTTQCAHGQFGWEDCIACYDDALIAKIAAIRLLSQGEKA